MLPAFYILHAKPPHSLPSILPTPFLSFFCPTITQRVKRQLLFLIRIFVLEEKDDSQKVFFDAGCVRWRWEMQQYSILLSSGDVIIPIIYRMPTKSKRVQFHKDVKRRRIRKSLSERIKRLSKKQSHFRTCNDEEMPLVLAAQQPMVKVEPKNKVLVKKGMFNFVQNINARIKDKIDFLLFGMIYVDEEALKSNKRDRSLLKSMFNYYSINSVRITDAFLILKIQLNFQNTYPVAYIIERLKCQGRREFYELACMLEGINNRFSNFQRAKTPTLYDHQIERELQKSEGKPCMLMISPCTIAFSKELIELTGYSMQYMAASCLLNRSFLFDLFLADNNLEELTTYLSNFDLSGKFRRGELSLDQLRQESSYESLTSIIDKTNNRVQVKTRRCNLGVGIACWSVEKVIAREKLMEQTLFSQNRERVQFEERKRQKELKEINTLLQETPNKSTNSQEKSINVCGYRSIDGVKIEHD